MFPCQVGSGGSKEFPAIRRCCLWLDSRHDRVNETSRAGFRPGFRYFVSYGSILPTSLIYIILSTRGCSPWRPDAVMSTTWHDRKLLPRIFKDRHWRAGHHQRCGALPASEPYLRMIRFQGRRAVKKKRQLFPGPMPMSAGSVTLPSAAVSR